MILRILKSNRPVNFVLFTIFGLLFWGANLLHPQEYPYYLGENKNLLFEPVYVILNKLPFLQNLISLVLAIALSFIVLQINNRYSFIRIRTVLPASLYILLIGGFSQLHTLHPVYFGAVFFLIAVYRLFDMFDRAKPYSAAFDAGFWLGIGSLFYFNLFLLLPTFLIGIAILSREYQWRPYLINLLGAFLPWFFAISYAVLTDHFLELLKTLEQNIITANNHFKSNIPLQVFLAFLILLTVLGSLKMVQQYDTKKVSSRKYFTFFFVVFIFSMLSFIFIPATSQEMLVIVAIPVCFLVSNFLAFMKSRFWSELIFTALFGMVIFMEIVSL
ncbi:MAG TPA: DUF6427 family protein [Draconibacterium sp.]|nr:DUF6427 family protein [Draconibacterium sp.]